MKIGVNSNGLALDVETSQTIAKNCDYLRISLDAGSPYMYLRTHGMPKKAFDQVLQNSKKFSEIREELSSKISFGMGFLTSVDTEPDMERFVRLAKEFAQK